MKRTKKKTDPIQLPDAVHRSHREEGFTQIPNDLIRNPKISSTAKAVLNILLSNQTGWKSNRNDIRNKMKEGLNAISSGLSELKRMGYIKQIQFRDKTTKYMKGYFLAITDDPFAFDFDENLQELERKGCEIVSNSLENHRKPENQLPGFPDSGFPTTKNTIYKNTNPPPADDEEFNINMKINPSMFEKFWNVFPNKAFKGKAKTEWDKTCTHPDRPIFRVVTRAIITQKKTPQWQNSQYIPYASTWISESRWLDDPKEMKGQLPRGMKPYIIDDGIQYNLGPDGKYHHCVTGEIYIP